MKDDPFRSPDDASNPFAAERPARVDPSINPYAPTAYVSESDGLEYDVEAFRNRYLSHEASVKSVGLLYMLPGIMILVFCVIFFLIGGVAWLGGNPNVMGTPDAAGVIAFFIYAGFGALCYYAGWGVRRFQNGPRIIVTILSGIGLVGFPFGTLINGYILYLLHGDKGKIVFSDRYQEVIRQTPQIKYKTSVVVKTFALLLLAVFLLAIGLAVFGIAV